MEIFKNTLHQQQGRPAKTKMSGISETEVGPPPVYGGSDRTLNPEEMFVASINSCLMLVFNHFADKFKVDVLSYSSEAQGQVEKTKNGLRFTNVRVEAKVKINDANQAEKIPEIAGLAEKYCLVSGSLNCPIEYHVDLID
jgi:organic hydroperoxide reductase OsmC/OhrA